MANDLSTNTLLLVIIAILIPPLAVFLKNRSLMLTLICVVLTLLFYVPGLIMALLIILR